MVDGGYTLLVTVHTVVETRQGIYSMAGYM